MKGLYAIVDTQSLAAREVDPLAYARAVLTARPTALQLRAKDLPPREVLGLLRALLPECRRVGARLFNNDRPDLAALAGCDGVHVGQHDMPLEQVRRLAPSLAVGVSTHNADELRRALAARPAYVAFGPVFATASKAQPEPTVGLRGLAAAAALVAGTGVPLVAIGGIHTAVARDIARFADAGAVIAGLYGDDPSSVPAVSLRAEQLHWLLSHRPDDTHRPDGSGVGGESPLREASA